MRALSGRPAHLRAQCAYFDSSAAFECQKPLPARVSPKDVHNDCAFFEPRMTIERETKSATQPSSPSSAKKYQAYPPDDLFK